MKLRFWLLWFLRNCSPEPRFIDVFPRARPGGGLLGISFSAHRSPGAYRPGKEGVQSQFFLPKPVVEFFDTQADPWHVKNLAEEAAHAGRIEKLGEQLDRWMIETRDLGLIPEPLFCDLAGPDKKHKTLHEFGQSADYPIERLLALAKVASLGEKGRLPDYLQMMRDENPIIRHWGAYGVFLARPDDAGIRDVLKKMASGDALAGNRIIAAQALALCGDKEAALEVLLKEAKEAVDGYVLLFAINAIQYSHTDDQLTREDWSALKKVKPSTRPGADNTGYGYAKRVIDDALKLWPERRKVD